MSESELKVGMDAIVEQLKQMNENLQRNNALQLMMLRFKMMPRVPSNLESTDSMPENLLKVLENVANQIKATKK